jgi:hypothetical protein
MTTTIPDGNGTTHFFDVYPAKRRRNANETIGRSMLFIPLDQELPGMFIPGWL